MTIELYVFPPSPRAFKVLSVANYLEIPYQLRLVDLRKGEQRTPQYAGMNPNLRMPTLKDGDYVLWEANAIRQFPIQPYERIRRWYGALSALPAWRRTLQQSALPPAT
jgi:glutathione S-transferase